MTGDAMEIKAIKDNIDEIPPPCKTCLYWEAPTEYKNDNGNDEALTKKKEWFQETLDEFGNCGFLIYEDGKPIGYTQYGSVDRFLNISRYPAASSLYGEDTIFLSCLFVIDPEYRGKGIGTQVLEKIIENLKSRGFESITTLARKGNPNNPSGPFKFYKEQGFEIEEDHPKFPLMRLEIE